MDSLTVGMVVNLAVLAVAVAISIPQLLNAIEVSRTHVIEMSPNSDKSVEVILLNLIKEAQHELVMYDDGDPQDGSLYESEQVIQALEQKLTDSQFRVDCVLNYPTGKTLFERKLGGMENVRIRRRAANQSTIHYKIIDGTKAYISRHRRGQETRNRKVIDCTNAMSRRRGHRPLALRRYFEDFESHAA